MDLLGLVDLVRLGSVSSGLRDVLQAPTRQLAMEHCRVASGRANRSEAHLQDLRGMMVEVAAQRDASEQRVDAAEQERDAALEVVRELRAHIREMAVARRQLEQAHAEELAEAKRARR